MPEIKLNFSTGLAYLIDRFGVRQKILAQRIGIKEQALTDYKMGRKKGDEFQRNKIADALGSGLAEHHIRQLGFMIRNGVPGDDAYERVKAQVANAANNDDAAKFNQALDVLFNQIKEFLRDNYGETLHVATGFERIFSQRFVKFDEWKNKITLELLEEHSGDTAQNDGDDSA